VFVKEDFNILPEHCKWDHTIKLTPGAEPKSSKVYPLFLLEQAELDAFLEENLRTGRIRPLKSPMAVPVFFIKKKDGSCKGTLSEVPVTLQYSREGVLSQIHG